MSVRYKDIQQLIPEDPTPNKSPMPSYPTYQGLTMNRWIPQPSSGLICSLSALCTGLLFIAIILIVTITRQGVDQTEQNMEVKLRNLSLGVGTKVEKLSQDAASVISKINGMEASVNRILSDDVTGSISNDIQRILGAVARLTEEIRKGNGSTDPLCEVGWTHYGLSCYYFSQRGRSWESAKKDCETKKAHLVVINGEEENTFLYDLTKSRTSWIGLTDVDGSWKWVDGTSYDVTPKFWQRGQPDEWFGHGLGGGEDCAQLKNGNGWNDDHCSRTFSYICEKKMP
ncbi:asialoglycoprotein receptor 1-like isoform X2 [Rana temporaria]|uniref:asialoglycoprotein receptor 1-like isoform X2 n=1 Tax=Rana temporaria TaxID=8407 RepID=UPI001AAC8899|nr:asialoglycoprotein receptor 1-like isoform X2 [Rana temporaria]